MKSYIDTNTDSKYPYLGINKNKKPYVIVLFTSPSQGTLVHSSNPEGLGEVRDDWAEDNFSYLKNDLVLSNKQLSIFDQTSTQLVLEQKNPQFYKRCHHLPADIVYLNKTSGFHPEEPSLSLGVRSKYQPKRSDGMSAQTLKAVDTSLIDNHVKKLIMRDSCKTPCSCSCKKQAVLNNHLTCDIAAHEPLSVLIEPLREASYLGLRQVKRRWLLNAVNAKADWRP